jgi:hypothetical protein
MAQRKTLIKLSKAISRIGGRFAALAADCPQAESIVAQLVRQLPAAILQLFFGELDAQQP